MNSHNSGSAAPPGGATGASGTGTATPAAAVNSGPVVSKGLPGAIVPPSSNSVIQTPLVSPQGGVAAAQPGSPAAAGPTVTLGRPPVQTAGSGATLNGNNNASPAVVAPAAGQTGVGTQTPHANHSQPATSAAVGAGSHIIKAEPPTTTVQPAVAPRVPVTAAAGPGGIRAPAPQMLAPRLPSTSPGQPSIGLHNIQLPPGEWSHNFLLYVHRLLFQNFTDSPGFIFIFI